LKIPVGECVGQDVHDVTVAQLEAACEKVEAEQCATVRKNTHKARKQREFVNAARALLKTRKFPTGTYSNSTEANRALRDCAEVGWLLSPSQHVAQVLEGTSIAISAFRVDVVLETFPDDDEPTRRVPNKTFLDQVVRELGVGWVAEHCRRIDDQRNAHVRSFQAGGRIQEFHGAWRPIQAHAEVDITNNSPLVRKITARFGQRSRLEIERRRQFITSLADTAARLRAVRQLGVRDWYLGSDLEKPFFCARVIFHGQSASPETKAIFDRAVAEAFVPAAKALFPKAAGGAG
jgi:hypothetical protein